MASGLSGPLSVPFAIAALRTTSQVQRILYAVLAFLAAWFAAYRIWLREYNRAETELQRNALPELKIELLAIFWDVSKIGNTNDLQIHVHAYLRVTNVREPETIIKGTKLSLSVLDHQYSVANDPPDRTINFMAHNTQFRVGKDYPDTYGIEFETLSGVRPLLPQRGKREPLTRGMPVEGLVSYSIPRMQTRSTESSDLPVKDVTITLVDSFDGEYFISKSAIDIPFGSAQNRIVRTSTWLQDG
jgi:hypothetical protein